MDIDKIVKESAEEIIRRIKSEGIEEDLSSRGIARRTVISATGDISSPRKIDALCDKAIDGGFYGICVYGADIAQTAERLSGKGISVCAAIGYPFGASTTESKVFEAKGAVMKGANEIDVMMNVGAAAAGSWDEVQSEAVDIVNAIKGYAKVNIAIASDFLDDEEKRRLCRIAKLAKADGICLCGCKPGYLANVADTEICVASAGNTLNIKVDGIISSAEQVKELISAGASIIVSGDPENFLDF